MTYSEVNATIDSFNRRKQEKEKERASFDYILANLIGISVARVYSEKQEFPTIGTIYPGLFEDEERRAEEREAERIKAMLLKYAENHNRQFNRKRGENMNDS